MAMACTATVTGLALEELPSQSVPQFFFSFRADDELADELGEQTMHRLELCHRSVTLHWGLE